MSIANKYGFSWETVWNHPDNAELKRSRKNPNVLLPGDVVAVPEITPRIEDAATEERHTYVKKDNLAQVRLRLLDPKRRPRKNVRYIATGDVVCDGQTDGDGYITLDAPPSAREIKLKVTEGSKTDEYTLRLGQIDPIEELSGVQQRLVNLGYPCGSERGTPGELTRTAIRAFQREEHLTVTGEIDHATRQALQEMHGS